MPERTEYAPGTPNWVDLGTNDKAAAKKFYGGLFGWTYEDQGPEVGNYTIASKNGKPVVGLMEMGPEQAGMPPAWGSTVAVSDADEATKRATSAGGTVIMGPDDVADAGRLSMVIDPTGAMIGLWEAKNHIGSYLVNEHGTFTWTELHTTDVDKAVQFYSALFGWKPDVQDMGGMDYTIFQLNGEGIAGAMKSPMEGVPSQWTVYFAVDDADKIVDAAKTGGASVIMEPVDGPPGRMATLSDPQGAVFSIIKPAEQTS
jgi:predicted enzyme related to lactoylglutathione lyase